MKGICENPNSYYYMSGVDGEFQPEECGYRTCKNCPYFTTIENEPGWSVELERERDRLERLFGIF